MSTHNAPFVIDATEETFEADVLLRSKEVPVVVDFWAPWCGPCRTLSPILERLAEEAAGAFLLVKVDIDQSPRIAGAFGVQSIPTVFAVKGGQIVDGFMGALPEPQVREFLDRLKPSPFETLLADAKAKETSDPAGAEAAYREALMLSPNDEAANVGLARVLVAAGRTDEAGKVLAQLERRGPLTEEGERVKAQIVLREGAEDAGDVAACRAALAADPSNRTLQFHLAEALAAAGQDVEALDLCLTLVEEDRKGAGEEARKLMLAVFSTLPDDSDLLSEYRRRLSIAL